MEQLEELELDLLSAQHRAERLAAELDAALLMCAQYRTDLEHANCALHRIHAQLILGG